MTVTDQEYSGYIDPELSTADIRTLNYAPLLPNEKVYALDSMDHTLLAALANAQYLRIGELARHLSLPASTVYYRIQSLESSGVIKGHFYILDPHAFHEIPVCLVVKSRVLSEKDKDALRQFCRRHPLIAWITFFVGERSAEVYLRVRSYAEASSVVSDLSLKFEETLGSVHITTQLRFLKYSTYPFKNLSTVSGR